MIFGTYAKPEKEEGEGVIEKREQDIPMTLPGRGKNDVERKVVVRVEKEGRIVMEKGELVLDVDPRLRELPLLTTELKRMKEEGVTLSLMIRVEGEAEQQRVIDVLNACASEGISKVKFTDEE